MSSSFHLYLTSNSCVETHPNNTLSHFRNSLPSDIELLDNVKVSLQSITFDANFSNLSMQLLTSNEHILLWSQEDLIARLTRPTVSITLENKFFLTPNIFIEYLHQLTEKNIFQATGKSEMKIQYYLDDGIFCITAEKCRISLHHSLFAFLNFDPTTANHETFKNEIYFNLLQLDDVEEQFIIYAGLEEFKIEKKIQPKCVKIKIEELKSKLSGSGYEKILAVIPFPSEEENLIFHYEITRKEYTPFTLNILREITVTLLDENDTQLFLLNGQPTILQLHCKKMSQHSFLLRINSTDSKNLSSTNTASHFQVQLPNSIDFNNIEHWGVALTSIIYPSRLKLNSLLSPSLYWISTNRQPGLKLTFNDKDIYDKKSFVVALNINFKQLLGTGEKGDILYDEGRNQIHIILTKLMADLSLTVSVPLADILGYSTGINIDQANSLTTNFTDLGRKHFPGKFHLYKLLPHTLIMYCDFIHPVIIGDKRAQILKMLPVHPNQYEKISSNDFVTHTCKHLDFNKLTLSNLSTLRFQLKHIGGEDIFFHDPHQSLTMCLLFQKMK